MTETHPHQSGDATVIGPECFASADESVICWRGENYYRAPDDDELAKVFVVMDGIATEVPPSEPTCFDPAHEHRASSCEVRDELRAVIEAAILREAATWETLFAAGPGQVVSVSDAAFVAAETALQIRADEEADRCPSCEHRAEFHQPEGCWYSVTDAKPGTTVGCNCIGWTA